MNNHSHLVETGPESSHGSFKAYVIGFILSIALTLVSFYLVYEHIFTSWTLIFVIVGLALVQAIIQLIFFLHLGSESKPRWNMTIFLFMLMVVIILVFGSLWIMWNLEERLMVSMKMDDSTSTLFQVQ